MFNIIIPLCSTKGLTPYPPLAQGTSTQLCDCISSFDRIFDNCVTSLFTETSHLSINLGKHFLFKTKKMKAFPDFGFFWIPGKCTFLKTFVQFTSRSPHLSIIYEA